MSHVRLRLFRVATVILTVLTVSAVAQAPEKKDSSDRGARPRVNRSLRRTARRLDRSLIQIDHALQKIDQEGGRRAARKRLRRVQRKLRTLLTDPDILCAFDELNEAIAVLYDPSFSPSLDTTVLRTETNAAASCVMQSVSYADSHADGFFFLGSSKDFSHYRRQTRIFFPLGLNGPFDEVRIRASGGGVYVDRLRIYFEGESSVESQVHNHMRGLDSGDIERRVLRGAYIGFVRITAVSYGFDGRRGRLKFWGIRTP